MIFPLERSKQNQTGAYTINLDDGTTTRNCVADDLATTKVMNTLLPPLYLRLSFLAWRG